MDCPSCGAGWRVNPFVLSFRSGPLPPAELEEAGETEADRLRQARNLALFKPGSITSVEELQALAAEQGISVPAETSQARPSM